MRNIVQIKQIDSIDPIENADAIEVAHIGGWNIVVKKNEFAVGDSILYFEIDSFLPGDVPEFEFLLPRGKKTAFSPIRQADVIGHVLKTAKLRGTVSQGLALPLAWGLTPESTQNDVDAVMEALGVFKWEPPVPVGGEMVGPFPYNARKTDSERVQNLSDAFLASLNKDEWVATEKIDGRRLPSPRLLMESSSSLPVTGQSTRTGTTCTQSSLVHTPWKIPCLAALSFREKSSERVSTVTL